MNGFAINTKVKWSWGTGEAEGKVTSRYTSKVTKTIKGNTVTLEASDAQPAYCIEQSDGDIVLKSHSELDKA